MVDIDLYFTNKIWSLKLHEINFSTIVTFKFHTWHGLTQYSRENRKQTLNYIKYILFFIHLYTYKVWWNCYNDWHTTHWSAPTQRQRSQLTVRVSGWLQHTAGRRGGVQSRGERRAVTLRNFTWFPSVNGHKCCWQMKPFIDDVWFYLFKMAISTFVARRGIH